MSGSLLIVAGEPAGAKTGADEDIAAVMRAKAHPAKIRFLPGAREAIRLPLQATRTSAVSSRDRPPLRSFQVADGR
jgi:hypothetical protein